MRALLIFLFCLMPVAMLAQEAPKKALDHAAVTSPRKSFEAFIEAVLNEPELDETERTARFNAYFDFENWLIEKEKADGVEYSDEEAVELKADWHTLFKSDEFRRTYKVRNVRVIEEPEPDWQTERAEIVIAMKNTVSNEDEKFKVLMTLHVENMHWRWYAIPRIEPENPKKPDAEPAKTTPERINQIEKELKNIEEARETLADKEAALKKELRDLKAAQIEETADGGAYSTPRKTVLAVWRAIQAEDTTVFLRAHLEKHRDSADEEAVDKRLKKDSARISKWEVLDTTVDANDENRAIVRVKISFESAGKNREKTLSLKLKKTAGEWLLNEKP
ncbi:MAG: hypothetical protein L3J82_10215 [Planctomycetes bacterium]|nr:hypothetical protein [Planctomycetota bacterium]